MNCRGIRITLVTVLLAFPVAASAGPTVVDTCGESFGGAGVLAADLDCTGSGSRSVRIDSPGGTLDLAGFTITGGTTGVSCRSGCTVFSSTTRGTILNSQGRGISSNGEKVTIKNISITGCGTQGIGLPVFSFNRDKAIVIDSEISNCGTEGIRAWDAKLIRSTLSGNGIGARLSGALRLIDSQITDNIGEGARAGTSPFKSAGFKGDKVLISGSTVSGNGTGLVILGPSNFKDSSIDDNIGTGVVFSKINESRTKARNTTFDRNGGDGVFWLDPLFPVSAKFKDCSASDNGSRGLHTEDRSIDKLTLIRTTIADNGDDGIFGAFENPRMLIKSSTITGNGGHGIANRQRSSERSCEIKFVGGSTATGNGTSTDCGVTRACADIAACEDYMPEVSSDSTCDTSYQLESGVPGSSWGVCALD